MRKLKIITALTAVAVFSSLGLAGCSSSSSGTKVIKVSYEKTSASPQLDTVLRAAKSTFEKEHKGVTIDLEPVNAADSDYETKLALSQRTAATAPDVFYEDTSNIQADQSAGYLLKLNPYLAKWSGWSQFTAAAKKAGAGTDGTYGVPLGVDARVIWYDKPVLQKAGIPVPWQPKSWQDILDAAAKIKAAEPGVVPFSMYAGTPMGESTTITSALMLLTGAGGTLYDASTKKWVVGSKAMTTSLTFLKKLYTDKYATSVQAALDPNAWQTVQGKLFPANQIGGTVEDSNLPGAWSTGGSFPWADYTKDAGVAYFPTENGGGAGYTSMSGGWTLAVGAKTKNPQLAFDFLSTALDRQNSLKYATTASQIAVRKDVASDPAYLKANPFEGAITKAVDYTHFRPSNSSYPDVSGYIQTATEDVVTGKKTPSQAASAYDAAVKKLVGAGNTVKK